LNETRHVISDLQDKNLFGALFNFYDILYNSDVVAHSCYSGFEDMAFVSADALNHTNATQIYNMFVNGVYHFGDIYDDL